jgi:hypothetical protein
LRLHGRLHYMDDFNPRAVQTLVILALAVKTLPWVPEPLVIEVSIRRGGSCHTSVQPHDHFGEFNIWTLFVIGLNLCESFHWLTNAHRLTNEKTHINIDQSQTEFKYWTYQSEAGFSCDQSLLVVSSLLHKRLWHSGYKNSSSGKQLGNLLSLCREIAGARDILQKFENLKKQHEWNFNLWFCIFKTAIKEIKL